MPAGPVARGDRIASLDIIRGIAVLGILLANITGFAHSRAAYYWPPALPGGASAADDWIWLAQFTLVDGKMRGLFALLFGAGLALFASRAGDPIDALTLQGRRLFWLGLFGIAHYALLFDGDILFIYATGGFVALLAMDWPPRRLIGIGLVWAVAGGLFRTLQFATVASMEFMMAGDAAHPGMAMLREFWQQRLAEDAAAAAVYAQGSYADIVALRVSEAGEEVAGSILVNFVETIPLILIGMGLFRAGLFTDAALRRAWRGKAAVAALAGAAALAATGLFVMSRGFPIYQTQFAFFGLSLLFNLPLILGGMLLLADWAAGARESWLGERLAQAGRMAFSNYIGTSLVMSAIFQGWAGGLFGTMHRAEMLLVVLMGWALMLTLSRLWLKAFRYGPLEWLWRCLTYWRLFPIRRAA